MAAGWSNKATKFLLTILGEQSIQNQLDGVVQNNAVCEKVSTTLQECGYEYSLFSHCFVFVVHPNNAKPKTQHY